MINNSKVYTTGQVAKICQVAPRTVAKWFDAGRIKGYRIPGSQDRRITEDSVLKFLKVNRMPQLEAFEEMISKRVEKGQEQ